jgi:hypothetical protein
MMRKLPPYYSLRQLMGGEPDRNVRFVYRGDDTQSVAAFVPDKDGWSDRNERELKACVEALVKLAGENET